MASPRCLRFMIGMLSLPWAIGEFASDTAFITANQLRMGFFLAAASDRPIGYREQKGEVASAREQARPALHVREVIGARVHRRHAMHRGGDGAEAEGARAALSRALVREIRGDARRHLHAAVARREDTDDAGAERQTTLRQRPGIERPVAVLRLGEIEPARLPTGPRKRDAILRQPFEHPGTGVGRTR